MTQSRQSTPADHSEQAQINVSAKEIQKPKATVAQSILIGSSAGGMEVLIDHPLWSIKTRMQRGDSFTFNPTLLYRGILPNAASMIPITAIQVSLNRCFQNIFFKNSDELSNSQRITSAFVAGIGSAFVSGPTEMVMTYQSKTGGSFYTAGKHLIFQAGWHCLFSGLPATMAREGMFTAFFLAVTPILKSKIQPYCSNSYAASLIAGTSAGIGATIASQGLDTIKTIQQVANPQQPISLRKATQQIYSTHGFYGFFKGGVPRGTRVMSAVTIMGWVNEKMEDKFRQYNSENKGTSEEKPKQIANGY